MPRAFAADVKHSDLPLPRIMFRGNIGGNAAFDYYPSLRLA